MSTLSRLLIVGAVAGGASCAARARRLSEDAEIIVFERGPYVSFANCGLPYHIGGEIPNREKLLLQTPEKFRNNMNIDVRVRTEVIAIHRDTREVEVRDLATGTVSRERYDTLVLSPGAAPVRPPIPGIDRPGIFTLRNIPDMDAINTWLAEHSARTAVVVGGGFIGLEMAEQLQQRGLEVAIVEYANQILGPLDPDMAAIVAAEMRKHGVSVHTGEKVNGFLAAGPGEVAAAAVVTSESGLRIAADIVIVGIGVRPECALARAAGLEVGELGGIRVSDTLQTSDPAIYAVGDAIEVWNPLLKQWSLVPLASPANRQGRIAADNIFGLKSRYRGTIGTSILRAFDIAAGCTGLNEKALKRAGLPYKALHLHPGSHAGYFPGAKPIALKLLFDPTTRAVLGAQAVGEDGVDKRIDVIATAIHGNMTIDDLAELELAYAPPYGSAKDPVNLAGMAAQNIANGLVDVAQWEDVAKLGDGVLILDVREPAEVASGAIPGSLNIPLPQLRKRLEEIPRDREILVHCQSGQRSYNAARLLSQRGFKVRNLAGSYKTWKMATSG
jgi:NADPH-dependent 2,4-dienoyl-CoA reductase/sulfur reductase-like enzyme/rhodanese-related sulfurtransferase